MNTYKSIDLRTRAVLLLLSLLLSATLLGAFNLSQRIASMTTPAPLIASGDGGMGGG